MSESVPRVLTESERRMAAMQEARRATRGMSLRQQAEALIALYREMLEEAKLQHNVDPEKMPLETVEFFRSTLEKIEAVAPGALRALDRVDKEKRARGGH